MAQWKKGRGNMGAFAPLIGTWASQAESPMGPVSCTRVFERTMRDKYVQLTATWQFGTGDKAQVYTERAIYGHFDGTIRFWSFTSDGKRSEGELAKAPDLHPEAFAFEAEMPAGRARMAYWPADDGGMHWAVEAKTKKGWSRMASHHYHAAT
ncbi:MAG: hypothetical protein ABJB74_16030 [Gemmatimonas sp.]